MENPFQAGPALRIPKDQPPDSIPIQPSVLREELLSKSVNDGGQPLGARLNHLPGQLVCLDQGYPTSGPDLGEG